MGSWRVRVIRVTNRRYNQAPVREQGQRVKIWLEMAPRCSNAVQVATTGHVEAGRGLMEPAHHLTFGPFRLDEPHGRLWRGEQVIALRPRSLAVLRYLVEQPGRLVTKAELHQHVWAGMHVTDTVLRVSIREIRAAWAMWRPHHAIWRRSGSRGIAFSWGEIWITRHWEGRPHRGSTARGRGLGAMVSTRGQRAPPARLPEWRGGHWQDDGGRSLSGSSSRRQRGTHRAGTLRGALWGGGSVPPAVRSSGLALPWARGYGRMTRANCWLQFTTGSPRASTPLTCRRLKHCWRNQPNIALYCAQPAEREFRRPSLSRWPTSCHGAVLHLLGVMPRGAGLVHTGVSVIDIPLPHRMLSGASHSSLGY